MINHFHSRLIYNKSPGMEPITLLPVTVECTNSPDY